MGVVQGLVGLGRDGGLAVPAEGLAHLFDEFVRLGAVQAAVPFELLGQRQRARREDVAPLQDLARLGGQRLVFEQFQSQQRGEHAEGLAASAASPTGRKAVEWTGMPATDRS